MDLNKGDRVIAMVRTGFFFYRRAECLVTMVPDHGDIIRVRPLVKRHRGDKWINASLQVIGLAPPSDR